MAKMRNSNYLKTYFTEMTEAMKINHFHAHLRKEALQTFRNISAVNRNTLDDVLIVFRRKFVKPESQATQNGTNGTSSRSIPIQNNFLTS